MKPETKDLGVYIVYNPDMHKYHYTGGGANRTQKEADIIKSQYEVFDKEYIHEIFKNEFNLVVTDIKLPMNVGKSHLTFVVSFKDHEDLFYRGNWGLENVERVFDIEKALSGYLLKNGIKSTKILLSDTTRNKYPFDFQVQETISGFDAEKVFEGTQTDYDKYSFNIGVLVAQLSKLNFDGFGHLIIDENSDTKLLGEEKKFSDYMFLELYDQIELLLKNGLIDKSTKLEIVKIFENAKSVFDKSAHSLVHYDLADHNLRYDPKTFEVSAVYDWEAGVVGDSILDLASAPTWKTLYPRAERMNEGYLSVIGKPEYFEEKLNLYRLRTIIWKIEQNIKLDLVTPERLKRLDVALEPFGLRMV